MKRATGMLIAVVCLFLICFPTMASGYEENQEVKSVQSAGSGEIKFAEEIIIPTVDDIRRNGYPKNEKGETYGPDVKELDNGPDLVLVRYGDGYGYIRQSEMDDDGVKSPKDVAKKMGEEETRKINVYLQDGTTCVGIFDLKG